MRHDGLFRTPDALAQLCKLPIRFTRLHHLSAVSVQRIIDDPLCCIDFVIVFVAEMTKAFGNRLQTWPFRLIIKRIVRVRAIHDFSEKDEGRIIRKAMFFRMASNEHSLP